MRSILKQIEESTVTTLNCIGRRKQLLQDFAKAQTVSVQKTNPPSKGGSRAAPGEAPAWQLLAARSRQLAGILLCL